MSRLKDIKDELKRETIKRLLWKLKTFFNYKVPDDRPSLFNLFEKDGNYYLLNREKGRITFNGYKKTSDDGLCFVGNDIEAYLKKDAKWQTVMDGAKIIAIELAKEVEIPQSTEGDPYKIPSETVKANKEIKEVKVEEKKETKEMNQEEEFKKLYNSGMKRAQIMKALNISAAEYTLIFNRLRYKNALKYGIERIFSKINKEAFITAYNSGVPVREIARKFSTSDDTIRAFLRKIIKDGEIEKRARVVKPKKEVEKVVQKNVETTEKVVRKRRGNGRRVYDVIKCPYCNSTNTKRNGNSQGKPMGHCNNCHKSYFLPVESVEKTEQLKLNLEEVAKPEPITKVEKEKKVTTINPALAEEIKKSLKDSVIKHAEKYFAEKIEKSHKNLQEDLQKILWDFYEARKKEDEARRKEEAVKPAPVEKESIGNYFLYNLEQVFTSSLISPLVVALILTIYLLLMPKSFLQNIAAPNFWVLILIPLYLIECIKGFIRSLK